MLHREAEVRRHGRPQAETTMMGSLKPTTNGRMVDSSLEPTNYPGMKALYKQEDFLSR
jgi:hypothetical protein